MNYFFRFSICGCVPEIFAIKVESCQKSRRILNVFRHPKFFWGRPSENCTHIITPISRHVVWIKICDDILINPDVIDVHTLNFKPNYKFSGLKFLGRPPSHLEYALGSIGQSLASVKIQGAAPPNGRNVVYRKCPIGWVNVHVNNFFVCGPKFTAFFRPTREGL